MAIETNNEVQFNIFTGALEAPKSTKGKIEEYIPGLDDNGECRIVKLTDAEMRQLIKQISYRVNREKLVQPVRNAADCLMEEISGLREEARIKRSLVNANPKDKRAVLELKNTEKKLRNAQNRYASAAANYAQEMEDFKSIENMRIFNRAFNRH